MRKLKGGGPPKLPKGLAALESSGDRVEFVVDEEGVVRLIPKHEFVCVLKGVLPKPDQPVSLEDMERAIALGAAGH